MGVGEWFSEFCAALRISPELRSSLAYRTGRITNAVNLSFRGLDSDSAYRFYVGSLGRGTAIPSVSDADLLIELPVSVYHQYNAYSGNNQSALLTAVRTAIRTTYSTSDVFGDGQVIVIEFDDGITYEVLPAFSNTAGGYTFADSNNGGVWRDCKPKQEMDAFAQRDKECKGNLVELARMARAWRDTNNAPMNGMLIDTLAYQFIGRGSTPFPRTVELRLKTFDLAAPLYDACAGCGTARGSRTDPPVLRRESDIGGDSRVPA